MLTQPIPSMSGLKPVVSGIDKSTDSCAESVTSVLFRVARELKLRALLVERSRSWKP